MSVDRTIRNATFVSIAAAFGLVSCQSTSTIDTVLVDTDVAAKQNQTTPSGATEYFGTGTTRVALILHRTGSSAAKSKSLEIRNGAAMAIEDLGSTTIKLSIDDTRSDPASLNAIARKHLTEKAQLIIVPGDNASLKTVASVTAKNTTPIVALGTNGPGSMYGFMPGGEDSLIAGIRYAAVGKKNKVVLVIPKAAAEPVSQRVRRAVGAGVELAGIATYTKAVSASDFIKTNAALLSSANVVAFGGLDNKIPAIAKAIRADKAKFGALSFVGRDDWSSSLKKATALSGTFVATRDESGLALVSKRYRKKYGKQITAQSAYAYDLVAVAAGLARSKGKAGLSAKTLQTPAGFRGTTGLFRFTKSGTVQRLYQISKIQNGRLRLIDKSAVGF